METLKYSTGQDLPSYVEQKKHTDLNSETPLPPRLDRLVCQYIAISNKY